jgi:hypothetical protein
MLTIYTVLRQLLRCKILIYVNVQVLGYISCKTVLHTSVWDDWFIIYCFKSSSRMFHWKRQHYRWKAAKFRPMLGAQGLWVYRATPVVTRALGLSGLIRRTSPLSRLIWHARGCWRPILTRILTGSYSVAYYDTQRDAEVILKPHGLIAYLVASYDTQGDHVEILF